MTMDPATLEDLTEQINAVLDAESVLYKINYRVESMEQQGVSIKAFCPIHKETMIRSLMIDPNKRHFRCNYSNCPGNKGGTFLQLYCMAVGCSEEEGVRFWCAELGIGSNEAPVSDPSRDPESEPKEDIPQFSLEDGQTAAAEPDQATAAVDELVEFDTAAEASPFEEDLLSSEEIASHPETLAEREQPPDGAPGDASEHQHLYQDAVVAFESNKYHSAMELFQRALQGAASLEAKLDCEVMLARCFVHLKKSGEALQLLRAALKHPNLPDVSKKEILYRTAEAWECGEQTEKAIEILRLLMEKFGPYRDTENWLNRLLTRRKQDKEEPRERRISFI